MIMKASCKRLIGTFIPPVALVGALCAVFAPPAVAHHSFAMFDYSKSVTVEGVVKEFQWTNPHSVLYVVANPKPGQAPQTWTLEMTSPGNLTRMGWNKRSLNAGDRVKVEFHQLRSGANGGSFMRAILTDTGKEVSVSDDVRAYGGAPALK